MKSYIYIRKTNIDLGASYMPSGYNIYSSYSSSGVSRVRQPNGVHPLYDVLDSEFSISMIGCRLKVRKTS